MSIYHQLYCIETAEHFELVLAQWLQSHCLQCFVTVGWRQEGHWACKKLSGGMLA